MRKLQDHDSLGSVQGQRDMVKQIYFKRKNIIIFLLWDQGRGLAKPSEQG